MPGSTIEITQVSPLSELGRFALFRYVEDIASRYYGRPVSREEVHTLLREDSSEDLVPPTGLFVVVRRRESLLGCAGLRLCGNGLGELKRMFVEPFARGQGLGGRLLSHLESVALDHDIVRLRLDTRSDLVEARRLYARHGYQEVEPFNDGPYAEHWFVKTLA